MPEALKLLVAFPTSGMVRAEFAYSLAGLSTYMGAKGLPSRRDAAGIDLQMTFVLSSVIHANREKVVRRAIDDGFTHLAFLDDDMVFAPDVLDVLAGRRHPVVAVNYRIKTEEGPFVAVGLNGQRVATTLESTGIVPIAYTGFGVSLFELRVFKAVPQPWFQPEFDPATGGYTTEDNPCYRKIREAGFDVMLDHDASKMVGHVGAKTWDWRDWKKPDDKPLCGGFPQPQASIQGSA